MMELSEIRGRDDRQLQLDLQELRKEYFTLRFRGFSEGVANTSRFRHIKRSVARILTVLGERERTAGGEDGGDVAAAVAGAPAGGSRAKSAQGSKANKAKSAGAKTSKQKATKKASNKTAGA